MFFLFFKQKTAYEMRISDWRSDVCSSDLIAGVRTRRIAMSFALFNILVLFSRTSNSFLGPFLAKRIETRIHDGSGGQLFFDMQMVLAAASTEESRVGQ